MTASHNDGMVGYRSKGPPGFLRTCAIMMGPDALGIIKDPERVCIEFPPASDTPRIIIRPHQSGFKINFKPGSRIGEVNVAWDFLERRPADATGKGRLKFYARPDGSLSVDITPWKGHEKPQPTLFAPQGRILIPHDSVGTGGMRSSLFDD